jgi:hypothetical protein
MHANNGIVEPTSSHVRVSCATLAGYETMLSSAADWNETIKGSRNTVGTGEIDFIKSVDNITGESCNTIFSLGGFATLGCIRFAHPL